MAMKSIQTIFVLNLFTLSACGPNMAEGPSSPPAAIVNFASEQSLGHNEKNPSTPFLRYAPDGRLFAIWSEDHEVLRREDNHAAGHEPMARGRAPSPMRNAFLAWSTDAGKTWSAPRRVNSTVEAVQGEENGPKVVRQRQQSLCRLVHSRREG
jgi:Neuraminidase (sialidase)